MKATCIELYVYGTIILLCCTRWFWLCKSVDGTLVSDHSNESYWAILSCCTVYYAVQGGSDFCMSVDEILVSDHSYESYWAVLEPKALFSERVELFCLEVEENRNLLELQGKNNVQQLKQFWSFSVILTTCMYIFSRSFPHLNFFFLL